MIAVLLCLGSEARAQFDGNGDPGRPPGYEPQPTGNPWHKPREKSPDRSGVAVSFGLGYGIAGGVGDTNDALGGYLRLGYRFKKSRALLAAEAWLAVPRTAQNQNSHFMHQFLGALAQFWLTPRFWLGPGAGAACIGPRNSDECSDSAFSLRGLAGYEFVHAPHFAADVQLQTGAEIFDNDAGAYAMLTFGLTWFDVF